MADIKTRDTSKGTIKTINKAAVATERMKKAYVMTKDKAEHSTNASENSAEEYASDKIEAATDIIVPPMNIQKEFARFCNPIMITIEKNADEIRQLFKLQEMLLSRLSR